MGKKAMEEIINDALKGDALKNALDFAAYLRASGISVGESKNYWELEYNGKCVCFVYIDGADKAPGPWTVWSAQEPDSWAAWGDAEYADFPLDAHTKEVAWANVNVCGNCGGCENVGGQHKTVLGREFDNLCNSAMAFTNPDADALNCAKKMIEIRLSDIGKGE